MSKRKIFEGDVYSSYNFGDFTILRYGNHKDIDIQFINTGTVVNTNSVNISKRTIRDPYAPSVCGVAHLGEYELPEDRELHGRKYTLWYNMIACCYDENRKTWFPHYTDCTVCDRWLCFAHFLEDLPKLKGYDRWILNDPEDRMVITKGSKYRDNRVFSPATCELVHIHHLNRMARVKRLGNNHPFELRRQKNFRL